MFISLVSVLHRHPSTYYSKMLEIQKNVVCSARAFHVLNAVLRKNVPLFVPIVHFVWLVLMLVLKAAVFHALQVIFFSKTR